MRFQWLILVAFALSASAQTSVRKSVCASGCDYKNTYAGMSSALVDAATYQGTSCVPYVIEIDPANAIELSGNTLNLPAKTCGQYIRIRSMQTNALPPDGVRINPSAQSVYLARIQSTTSSPGAALVQSTQGLKTRYWAFEGIDFYGSGQNGGVNYFYSLLFFGDTGSPYPASLDRSLRPDHFEMKHCWVHGVPGTRNVANGIHVAGNDVRLADNVIEDIAADGVEAHAVIITYSDGRVDLVNNVLDSSTENTLVGGTYMSPGTLPSFLRFIGNKFSKKAYYKFSQSGANPSWACRQGNVHRNTSSNHDWICDGTGTWIDQGGVTAFGPDVVKNIWEIKMGRGVRVYGNDLSGIWYPSAQNAEVFVLNLSTQNGTCGLSPLFQPCNLANQPWTTTTDVDFAANTVHDAISFMSLAYPSNGGGPCASRPDLEPWCYQYAHNEIRMHDNLSYNMADERDYDQGAPAGGWFGVLNAGDFNIDIRHNTYLLSTWSAPSGAMNNLLLIGATGTISGTVNFRDNIIPMSYHGITASGSGLGGLCTFITGLAPGAAYNLGGNILTLDKSSWAGSSYPIVATSTVPTPCNSYFLWPTGTISAASGAKVTDSGFRTLSGYKNTAGDGRDAGADVDRVNWATAGAVDGSPNPALEYKLRSSVLSKSGSQRGASIYFTAPDVNACTWELSPDANAYTSPVPVTSQTRSGRDGIALWSGLAAGQVYFARATCDGLKLETGVEGRRFMFVTAP